MSMTDPIADLLTRIRNAQKARHESVSIPRSKIKVGIVSILKSEGFVEGYIDEADKGPQGNLKVFLRYNGKAGGVIRGLKRISKPGRRVYVGKKDIPRVRDGLGLVILTTPRGLLTDLQARQAGVGGEVVCHVW
jgi:small subunit ribosomal protein S8